MAHLSIQKQVPVGTMVQLRHSSRRSQWRLHHPRSRWYVQTLPSCSHRSARSRCSIGGTMVPCLVLPQACICGITATIAKLSRALQLPVRLGTLRHGSGGLHSDTNQPDGQRRASKHARCEQQGSQQSSQQDLQRGSQQGLSPHAPPQGSV